MGLSPTRVLKIWRRDGFKCVECGATENLSVDHVIPRVRGGSNDDDNLRTLCRSCNSRKSAKDRLYHRGGVENLGVPRELVAFRLDQSEVDRIDVAAADDMTTRSEIVRRMLAYAAEHMPHGWQPPKKGN